MKTFVLVAVFFLMGSQVRHAQSDFVEIKKIYNTWILPEEGGKLTKGVLFELKDSSVMISNSSIKKDYYMGKFKLSEMDAGKIKKIMIRKKGNVAKAMMVGALHGVILGTIIVVAQQNNNAGTESEQELHDALNITVPLFSTVAGMAIGAAIGSVKIKIPINGSQTALDLNKEKLEKYSLKHNSGGNFQTIHGFSKLRDVVTDFDSNKYHTLALGGQVWIAENLRTTHYRDGSEIKNVVNNDSGDECRYDWPAVSDSSKLCPGGWHVPSVAEWTSLYNSLGGQYGADVKLEESFNSFGKKGQWWSSTEQNTGNAQCIYLDNNNYGVMFTTATKSSGLSVRCVRDY